MKIVETIRELVAAGLSQQEAYKVAEKMKDPAVKAGIILKAFNTPPALIEQHLGLAREELNQFLKIPELKDLYNRILGDIALIQDDSYFEMLLPKAMQVKIDLLDNENASPVLRDKIASDFIDRIKGKPRQSLEVKALNYNIDGTEEELEAKIGAVAARIKELESLKTKQLETQKS